MNVGHFAIMFPTSNERGQTYGSEHIMWVLCNGLATRVQKCFVFVPDTNNSTEVVGHGIRVVRCRSRFSLFGYLISSDILKRSLTEELDVVHIHNDSPMSMIAGMIYARKKRVPLVITWHGDWLGVVNNKAIVWLFNLTFVRYALRKACRIIVPSRQYVAQSNVLPPFKEKIVEIHHGMCPEYFDQLRETKPEARRLMGVAEDHRVVLFVGLISEEKGVDVLLGAARDVLTRVPRLTFIFVGGGDVTRYEELARSLGLGKQVRFEGYMRGDSKWLYYKAADIFVFPSVSRHEIFGIVNIEAAAAGLPLVLSDLGIFKGLFNHGRDCLFFNKGDSRSLAERLLYLLQNEEAGKVLGRNARRALEERFSATLMVDRTIAVYEKALADGGPGREG